MTPHVHNIPASHHANDQLMIIFLWVAFIEYLEVTKKNRLNVIQKIQRSRLAISQLIYLLIYAPIITKITLGIHMSSKSFRRICL